MQIHFVFRADGMLENGARYMFFDTLYESIGKDSFFQKEIDMFMSLLTEPAKLSLEEYQRIRTEVERACMSLEILGLALRRLRASVAVIEGRLALLQEG